MVDPTAAGAECLHGGCTDPRCLGSTAVVSQDGSVTTTFVHHKTAAAKNGAILTVSAEVRQAAGTHIPQRAAGASSWKHAPAYAYISRHV